MGVNSALQHGRLLPIPSKPRRGPLNNRDTERLNLNKPLPPSPSYTITANQTGLDVALEELVEAQKAPYRQIIGLVPPEVFNTSLIERPEGSRNRADLLEERAIPDIGYYQDEGDPFTGIDCDDRHISQLTILCDLVDNGFASNQGEDGSQAMVARLQEALMKANPTLYELHLRALNPGVPGTDDYYATLTSPPNSPVRWSPDSWLAHYKWELGVCSHITGLILDRYKPEGYNDHEVFDPIAAMDKRWPRVHQAFWRVWTFCLTFGCNKNREGDIQKQQQWLSGTASDTETMGATIDPSETPTERWMLLPEGFGYGNRARLSVREVKDMQVVWKFLEDILRKHVGNPPPDWEWQPEYQYEWIYYILTLGFAAVYHLLSRNDPYERAAQLQWTVRSTYSPRKSRRPFLLRACDAWIRENTVDISKVDVHPSRTSWRMMTL